MRRHLPLVVLCLSLAAAAAWAAPGPIEATRHRNPEPVPIPGGLDFGGQLFHVFLPGPVALGFQGEDIEPNVITNFNGFVAMAYLAGTASGSDGRSYDLSADIRAYEGEYVAADGSHHHGSFGFV